MFSGGADSKTDPTTSAFSYSKMFAGASTSDGHPSDYELKVDLHFHWYVFFYCISLEANGNAHWIILAYYLQVNKFLDMSRDDDNYEEKVRKLIEEASKYKKERKNQEDKTKKKDRKSKSKKNKKESKKRKKEKKSKGKKDKSELKETELREALKWVYH